MANNGLYGFPLGGKEPIAYNWPLHTGQTTSYRTGDDVYFWENVWQPLFEKKIKGRRPQLTDFFTLKDNNAFHNKNRFTDQYGLQVYTNNYIIDHYTGLGWYNNLVSGSAWNTAIDAALALSYIGYDDWFVPDVRQLESILSYSHATNALGYTPFGISSTSKIWTSTTSASDTTYALTWRVDTRSFTGNTLVPNLNVALKTSTVDALAIYCRKHF